MTLHARFDAVQRTYKYFVTAGESAFLHPLSWHSPSPLDVDAMNDAAATLLQDTDFTSFAKLHSDAKTNVCDVREARWERTACNLTGEEMLVFTISADRFLRNMVLRCGREHARGGRARQDVAARVSRCGGGPRPLFCGNLYASAGVDPVGCSLSLYRLRNGLH